MILAVACCRYLNRGWLLRALPAVALLFLGYYEYTHPDKYNNDANRTAKEISLKIKALKSPDDKLFFFGGKGVLEERALVFYSDMWLEDIPALTRDTKKAFIIVEKNHFVILRSLLHNRYFDAFEMDGFVIVRI